MPLNFVEIEVRYETQTKEAGLRSDGELVQAVSEEPNSASGGGSGKANVGDLTIVKYVDSESESLDFDLSAVDQPAEEEIGISHWQLEPVEAADDNDGLADTLVWQVGGTACAETDVSIEDNWVF